MSLPPLVPSSFPPHGGPNGPHPDDFPHNLKGPHPEDFPHGPPGGPLGGAGGGGGPPGYPPDLPLPPRSSTPETPTATAPGSGAQSSSTFPGLCVGDEETKRSPNCIGKRHHQSLAVAFHSAEDYNPNLDSSWRRGKQFSKPKRRGGDWGLVKLSRGGNQLGWQPGNQATRQPGNQATS